MFGMGLASVCPVIWGCIILSHFFIRSLSLSLSLHQIMSWIPKFVSNPSSAAAASIPIIISNKIALFNNSSSSRIYPFIYIISMLTIVFSIYHLLARSWWSISERKPSTLPPKCPPGYLGEPPECKCYEDNTAYFGNNAVSGQDNFQPSRASCQRACAQHPTCEFWTWGKGEAPRGGPCYLKTARDNVTPGLDSYVSGSKHCKLPEAEGNYRSKLPGGWTLHYGKIWGTRWTLGWSSFRAILEQF